MNMDKDKEHRWIWLGLNEMEDIGWRTMSILHERFRPLDRLLDAEPHDLIAFGIHPRRAERICRELDRDRAEEGMRRLEKAGGFFLTRFDPAYPPLLAEIAAPPWVLYGKGDPAALARPLIAVVGTRRATSYGRKAAEDLSRELSRRGIGIVSGLARGIDGYAHRGALDGAGKTIAVLAAGLTHVYPQEHRELYERIGDEGLLLTEMPLDTQLHPGLFPQRNRIVAGLALGTLIVEAAEKSGSLITAQKALDASRDVFAVPGPISARQSQGTLEWIKQGAKMVTCAMDIIEEYPFLKLAPGGRPDPGTARGEVCGLPSADERAVLDLIGPVPVSFDELLERTGFAFGHLHALLLSLHMTHRIEQDPGAGYVRRS